MLHGSLARPETRSERPVAAHAPRGGSELIAFRAPAELGAGLRRLAVSDGVTMTELVRRAVTDLLIERGVLVCGPAGIALAAQTEVVPS